MSDECIPGFEAEVAPGQIYPICNLIDRWTTLTATGTRTERTVTPTIDSLVERYPSLERVLNGEYWQLLLQTDQGVIALKPLTMAWVDAQGNRSITLNTEFNQILHLEFAFQINQREQLQNLALWLKEAPDASLKLELKLPQLDILLRQIDTWLSQYTRDSEPWIINTQSIAAVAPPHRGYPEKTATASGQMRLISSCLLAYSLTQLTSYRYRALTLGQALVDYFYRQVPRLIDTQWIPQEWLNAGEPIQSDQIYFDRPISFTNGISQPIDTELTQVYKVYQGQLSSYSLDAQLISGRSYEIDSWIDRAGQEVTAAPQAVEIIPPVAQDVIYGYAEDIRFILSYNVSIFAVL